MPTPNHITVETVTSKSALKRFLSLPYDLYRGDPAWRAPLRIERRDQLDPEKNPAAKDLTRTLYLATQNGRDVGRIAVFTNPAHDTRHDPGTAFFGYLDTVDNAEVITALLSQAETWARAHDRIRLVGPAQWGVNEEVGLLVDGFDNPNVMLMSYGKPYYQSAVEAHGFVKAIDMYAFQANLHEGYPRPKMTRMMVDYAKKSKAVTWRKLDKKNFTRDIENAMDVFNDAWGNNWGFLPFPPDAIQHLAKEMKPLIHPDRFYLGYIDEELAAFICLLPDLNELVHGFEGKLNPINIAKLLYRMKFGQTKQSRVPLMGLRTKFHNTRKGLSLVASLCETVFEAGREAGYTHCELSWILEDNEGMISICKQASAVPYKTYRMYEKTVRA